MDLKVIEFNLKFLFSIFYTRFSSILSILEKWTGQGWRWRWRWRWKIFNWKFCRKWNGMQPTCIEGHKKILGQLSSLKFFTVDPYFGVTFLTGQENLPTFSTYKQFWPWWGLGWVPKMFKPGFGMGQVHAWWFWWVYGQYWSRY